MSFLSIVLLYFVMTRSIKLSWGEWFEKESCQLPSMTEVLMQHSHFHVLSPVEEKNRNIRHLRTSVVWYNLDILQLIQTARYAKTTLLRISHLITLWTDLFLALAFSLLFLLCYFFPVFSDWEIRKHPHPDVFTLVNSHCLEHCPFLYPTSKSLLLVGFQVWC